MEQVIAEHWGPIAILLGTVLMAVGPIIFHVGRLTRRVDDHQTRIEGLEKDKVDAAVCTAFHEGIERELAALRQAVSALQTLIINTLKQGNG